MKNNKVRVLQAISMFCNLAVIVFTVMSVMKLVLTGSVSNRPGDPNTVCFRYFTTDSNILCALCCIPVFVCNMMSIRSGKNRITRFALVCKLIGTAAVTLTMMTVLLFLGFVFSFREMFSDTNLYLHLLNPLLALLSFGLLEGGPAIRFRSVFAGALPCWLYGAVYLVMVMFVGAGNGGWPDFYRFAPDGHWIGSFVLMYAAGLACSVLVWLFHKLAGRVAR